MKQEDLRTSSHSMPRLTLPSKSKYYNIITRVSPFKRDYQSTFMKQIRKSNVYELATSIYKKAIKNSPSSPKKIVQQIKSIVHQNPEEQNSPHSRKRIEMIQFVQKNGNDKVLNNLNEKALKVPQYSQILSNLSKERQELNKKIQILRNKIALQHNLKYKLQILCKKNSNAIQQCNQNINKLHIEMKKVNILANESSDEVNLLKIDLENLNQKNTLCLKEIEQEKNKIHQLEEFNRNQKYDLIKQEKILNQLKPNLTVGLKNLQNNVNYMRYLESEKAQMLLTINRKYQQKWNKHQ